MEGRPRFDQEQANDDDDSKESSKPKKRKSRGFSLSSFIEKPRTEEGGGDQSERSTGRSWLSRYERIKRHKDVRPIIGEVQAVEAQDSPADPKQEQSPDSQASELAQQVESEEVTPTEEVSEPEASPEIADDHSKSVEAEEIVETDDTDETPDTRQKNSFADELLSSVLPSRGRASQEQVDQDSALSPESPLVSNPEPSPNSPLEDELPIEHEARQGQEQEAEEQRAAVPVTEPESIEAILRRRQLDGQDSAPEEAPSTGGGVETAANNVTNHETYVYNSPNRNAGLHLLNYAIARRRDARDRNAANKQFSQLNARVEELQNRQQVLEQEKLLLERHQNNAPSSSELHLLFERNKEVNKPNVDKKTTEFSGEKYDTGRQIVETKVERPSSRKPETLRQFQPAARAEAPIANPEIKGIVSEKTYEQRHEIKDRPTQPAPAVLPTMTSRRQSVITPAQQSYTSSNYAPPAGKSSPQSTKGMDYKEAAVTGAWGAVVGALVFIVFYILTR